MIRLEDVLAMDLKLMLGFIETLVMELELVIVKKLN